MRPGGPLPRPSENSAINTEDTIRALASDVIFLDLMLLSRRNHTVYIFKKIEALRQAASAKANAPPPLCVEVAAPCTVRSKLGCM